MSSKQSREERDGTVHQIRCHLKRAHAAGGSEGDHNNRNRIIKSLPTTKSRLSTPFDLLFTNTGGKLAAKSDKHGQVNLLKPVDLPTPDSMSLTAPLPPAPVDGIGMVDEVDFGNLAGSIKLVQLSYGAFNERCKTHKGDEIEEDGDRTGLRVYTGAQAMVRFLYRFPWLIKGQRVVELGCGVGAVGLLASRLGPTCVVLTDGSVETLELTRRNVATFQALPSLSPGFSPSSHGSTSAIASLPSLAVHKLQWDSHAAIVDLLHAQKVDKFDVVIGTDLMYYNVDASVVLTAATCLLDGRVKKREKEGGGGGGGRKVGEESEPPYKVNKDEREGCTNGGLAFGKRRSESEGKGGIILLAHIFRGAHLPYTLLAAAESLGWALLEVPMEEVVSEEGEGGGKGRVPGTTPEWWGSMCVLVGVRDGGREEGKEEMLARLPQGSRVFVPYWKEGGEGGGEEDEELWSWQSPRAIN